MIALIDLLNAMLRLFHDATHHHTELDKPGVANIRLCYWRWPFRRIEWAWTSIQVPGAQGFCLLKGITEAEFIKLFEVAGPQGVHDWLAERQYEWRT